MLPQTVLDAQRFLQGVCTSMWCRLVSLCARVWTFTPEVSPAATAAFGHSQRSRKTAELKKAVVVRQKLDFESFQCLIRANAGPQQLNSEFVFLRSILGLCSISWSNFRR